MTRVYEQAGWQILRTGNVKVGRQTQFSVDAVFHDRPARCPNPTCDAPGRPVVNNSKTSKFWDVPDEGIPAFIRVKRKQYLCRTCGTSTYPRPPGIDDDHQMTDELVHFLLSQAVKMDPKELARQAGIHKKTVDRLINEKHPDQRRARWKYGPPHTLGIYRIQIQNRPRTVFVDFSRLLVIDTLASIVPSKIARWLSTLQPAEKAHLRVVSVDVRLGERVRSAVRENLGSRALLMADTAELRHVLQGGVWRAQDQKSDAPTRYAQTLEDAFNHVLSQRTPADVEKALSAWEGLLKRGTKRAFRPLANVVDKWRQEIANHSDRRAATVHRHSEHVHQELFRLQRLMGRLDYKEVRAALVTDPDHANWQGEVPVIAPPQNLQFCEEHRRAFARDRLRGIAKNRARGFAFRILLEGKCPCYWSGTPWE